VIEPLRLSFQVDCTPPHAFGVWTGRIGQWWPTDHSVSAERDLDIILEPRVGGRLFERTATGQEHDWGEVTVWDPPKRLAYLWHLRRDRADATEVEISFHEDGEATRIDIEHRGWERLGADGPDWRNRNQAGWGALVAHFTAFITRERETT
jgi:uncharacterized protein YndB with AHSA1/START domain